MVMADSRTTDGHEVRKRSVLVAGHATSISLEDTFWNALLEIAEAENRSVNDLVTAIDQARGGNLSSAIRVFVLNHARSRKDSVPPTGDE